tara:strand:+ start:396 stop:572 length:177 start_codon:yes stop_codon:yes gene_type:complete
MARDLYVGYRVGVVYRRLLERRRIPKELAEKRLLATVSGDNYDFSLAYSFHYILCHER